MKILTYFLLLGFLFFDNSCSSSKSQSSLQEKVLLQVKEERYDDENLYNQFKLFGKEAIPLLIDAIDKDKLGFVGFKDANSSSLYMFHQNYVGIRAAYMIEYLLSGTSTIRIYEFGVIVKKEKSGQLKMEALTYNEVRDIKRIYEDWWEKNKNESMDELNKVWKQNKSPLNNSSYSWQ